MDRLFEVDVSRTSDIYMIAASGQEKEPHKVTFDSYNDGNPRFGPDGRKLFFQRVEAGLETHPLSSDLFSLAGATGTAIRTMRKSAKRNRLHRRPAEGGEGAAAGRATRTASESSATRDQDGLGRT